MNVWRATLASTLVLAIAMTACVSPSAAPTPGPGAIGATAAPGAPAATPSAAPTTTPATATTPAPGPSAWTRIADIPTPRSEVAAVVDQFEKAYVIGGFGGPDRVERFDPVTGRWERVADLPHGVDHPMAAVVFGLQSGAPQGVFVFGGYARGAATARAFRFDVSAGTWSEIAPMPGPRAAGAAVAIGGRIYVVGGADAGRLVSPTYEYDVTTQTWRTLAAIPTPRDHLAAVALDAKVCAVGGRRLSMAQNLATFECYDPRADSWERLPDAPTARGGIGAAVSDRRVYVVGGEQPLGTFKQLEIYEARTNAWTRGPDLPTPRHGIGVVVAPATKALVSGTLVQTPPRLLVLTGGPTPGGSQTPVCEMLQL